MCEDFADFLAGEWAPGRRSRVDEASGVRWFGCACALATVGARALRKGTVAGEYTAIKLFNTQRGWGSEDILYSPPKG